MKHACGNCPLRKRAEKKPESILARLWRWHTKWCPGYKAYLKDQTKNESI